VLFENQAGKDLREMSKQDKVSKLAKQNKGSITALGVILAFLCVSFLVLSGINACNISSLGKENEELKTALYKTQKKLDSEIERRRSIEQRFKKAKLPPNTPAMRKLAAKWSAEVNSHSIQELETYCSTKQPTGEHTVRLARTWANLKKMEPADSYHFLALLNICYLYKKMVEEPTPIGMKLLIRWTYRTYVAACKWHSYYNMPLVLSSFIRKLEFELGTYRNPHYRSVAPGPCPETMILRRNHSRTVTARLHH